MKTHKKYKQRCLNPLNFLPMLFINNSNNSTLTSSFKRERKKRKGENNQEYKSQYQSEGNSCIAEPK